MDCYLVSGSGSLANCDQDHHHSYLHIIKSSGYNRFNGICWQLAFWSSLGRAGTTPVDQQERLIEQKWWNRETERDEVVQMITSGSVCTFHTSQGLIIPQCFGKTRKTWKLRNTGKLPTLCKNILWKSKSESCCRWSNLSENIPRQGARDAYISKIRSL